MQDPDVAKSCVRDVDLTHRDAPCPKALREHRPRDQRPDVVAILEQPMPDVGEDAR